MDQLHTNTYQPRNPQASHYFQCTQDHFEQLEMVWDDQYANRYGIWRPHIRDVIYQYLDCGDLHHGFARVRCPDCKYEYILAFSCKQRHFCPSCHQKRVILFGQELCENILKHVPHRQWIFSIPKRLRIYFMYDRRLLAKLSRCAWNVVRRYLTEAVPYDDAVPGAVITVQTFGDALNFNPHLHIIATDGCFYGNGSFIVCPRPDGKTLDELFRHEVFKLLKSEGKITDSIMENMMNWRHTGFNVYCGDAIWPNNKEGLENLARYIIRASFSQERMTYIPIEDSSAGAPEVLYKSKDGKTQYRFQPLDWLALLTTHIPNKNEQLARYYGFYSNKSRGLRIKAETDDEVPSLIESDVSLSSFRKRWAALIRKIYKVDPLICPKCQGTMRIISAIRDPKIVEKILRHLDLWDAMPHGPPRSKTRQFQERTIDYAESQLPENDHWLQ